MPQPLPPNPYNINTQFCEHNAYATCLTYEGDALAGLHPVAQGLQSVTLARVLGYLILYAPTELGRTNVSSEVTSCTTTENLADLAKLYATFFIRYFKSEKGPIPALSTHSSMPSFNNVSDTFLHMLQAAPQDHQRAKSLALIRDGYRCVITGRIDSKMLETKPELEDEYNAAFALNPNILMAATNCAHIFPESLNHSISGENEGGHKYQHASTIWAVMERFGQVLGVDELSGANIHRIENVMTMDSSIHLWFNSLVIWMEATPTINEYNVQATRSAYLTGVQNPITLPTNRNLHAPDPRYLKLHAACAQVAHRSGAGEHIDNILRDLEDIRVLAKDGSSSDLLNFKLSSLTRVS